MRNKRVIGITGATGFVGKHLVKKLNDEGFTTRALVRDLDKENEAEETIQGDLETGNGLEEFTKDLEVIVNLVGRFQPPFKDQLSGNAVTLESLCTAVQKNEVKKIIHISATAVYGLPQEGQIFIEKNVPLPDTLYALSKKTSEDVANFYNRNFGLSFIILRPPNIYGPDSDHGVVCNFIKSVKETGGVIIHGDGTQKRDFLYIGDLVDAIIKCLDYKTGWDVFNITTADPKDLNELVSTLSKVMGKEIKITYQGEAQGAKVVSADNSKAQEKLGWEPKTSLEEGLAKTIAS